jgi:hypothetical protein
LLDFSFKRSYGHVKLFLNLHSVIDRAEIISSGVTDTAEMTHDLGGNIFRFGSGDLRGVIDPAEMFSAGPCLCGDTLFVEYLR